MWNPKSLNGVLHGGRAFEMMLKLLFLPVLGQKVVKLCVEAKVGFVHEPILQPAASINKHGSLLS
jgi:hypothetical protein